MRSIRASLVLRLIIAATIAMGFAATPAWARPEASGARAGLQEGGVTRFVLDLSEQIDVRIQTQTGPNRIVVDTPDLEWHGGFAKPLGPFKEVRYTRQGGNGRVLIDLQEPVAVQTAFLIPPRQGFNWRLVIDVAPATVAAVRTAKPIEIGTPRTGQIASADGGQGPHVPIQPRNAASSAPVATTAQKSAKPNPQSEAGLAETTPSITVSSPSTPTPAAVQTSSFVITSPALNAAPRAPDPVGRPPVEEARPSLSPVSSAMAAPVAAFQPAVERGPQGVRSVSMPLPPAVRSERVAAEPRPAVTPVATTMPAPVPAPAPVPPNTGKAAEQQLASLPMRRDPPARKNEPESRGQAKKADEPRVVVIDPGHGGVDPGALSISGVFEKNITLGVAQAVKTELEKKGRYRVVLTRDRDIFIPLRERVKIARQAGADLFVSLHADSVANPSIRGLSVYTLSENASDSEAAALAEKENKVDLIGGLDLSHESPEVTNILIDLTQRETMNRSAGFAQTTLGELGEVTTLLSNSHRFAGFAVLKAPDVPSVLIELGYLSNKVEEPLLRQASYRAKLAAALARSVERYFATPVKGKRS